MAVIDTGAGYPSPSQGHVDLMQKVLEDASCLEHRHPFLIANLCFGGLSADIVFMMFRVSANLSGLFDGESVAVSGLSDDDWSSITLSRLLKELWWSGFGTLGGTTL